MATAPAVCAAEFVERLHEHCSAAQVEEYRRIFKARAGEPNEGDAFLGVRMGQTFALAKEFIAMPLGEIEQLLESAFHEVRVGGLSIMDKQARRKRTPESCRKDLFDLYLRRIDRIDNWDLVDVCCPHVVGGYLFEYDQPRSVLYDLARSANIWERRTAIVSTGYFIRQGDVADSFAIAALLLADEHDLIHKATGWMLREAGKRDRPHLLAFLDTHAAMMPRVMLRYAVEHLDPEQRTHYMGMRGRS